jgi:hypothetical protein
MHLVGYKVLTLAADPGTGAAGYTEACLAFFSFLAGWFAERRAAPTCSACQNLGCTAHWLINFASQEANHGQATPY